MTNETMEYWNKLAKGNDHKIDDNFYNVGDLVMVTKDIQFKINGDICQIFQGSTGTVTAVGNAPTIYGGFVPMVTVSIDGAPYNFLASDICYKL